MLLTAGDRGAPGGQGGAAGGGQPGRRGDLPAGGGRDRLDQAVRLPSDGGGPLRAGDPGRQPVGRVHLPEFLPAYDAAATLVNLLAMLTATGRKLSELVAELPAVHIVHQAVHTPWDQKGMVMRTLVERSQGRELVLVDGVKVIEDDGWALVLPDPEEPLTHVWAEAASDAGPRPGPRSTPSGWSNCALTRRRPGGLRRRRPCGRVSSAPMNVPEDLRYSSDHEWARTEGDRVRIGITDYAQDALGDVVFVDLPDEGATVEAGGLLGEVESTKSVSEIYAPVAGEVVAVNTRARRCTRALNADPYGDGWICEIVPTDPSSVDALLDASGYRQLTEG